MLRKHLVIVAFTLFAMSSASLLASPVTTVRPGQDRPAIGHLVVGGPVSYQVGWGFWGGYAPYYGGWGPWGPWGGYGYYGGWYNGSSMQIQVKPKETEVYVDGWRAGIVDNFDSWYQSLNLQPGGHEIVLYLEGYRTQRHQMYFTQMSSQRLKSTMEKLAAGESSGPRPQPAPRAEGADGRPRGPRAPRSERAQAQSQAQSQGEPQAAQATRFGTLSVKVLPADATILVDDQSWVSVGGAEQRLSIKLSAGRHHIEVSKAGFETYVEDILIRPEATMTLNVGLTKK